MSELLTALWKWSPCARSECSRSVEPKCTIACERHNTVGGTSIPSNSTAPSAQVHNRLRETQYRGGGKGVNRPIEWGRRVCRGFVFYPGGSAVWPQCWL